MNFERSYNQKVKDLAMAQQKQLKVSIQEVYAQMVVDEIIFNSRKKQLERQIDESLAQRNRDAFMTLSEEFNRLCR